jgi:hypothetical protein
MLAWMSDLVHASGRCAFGFHEHCSGIAGRSDGRIGLCWCRCHEEWLETATPESIRSPD